MQATVPRLAIGSVRRAKVRDSPLHGVMRCRTGGAVVRSTLGAPSVTLPRTLPRTLPS